MAENIKVIIRERRAQVEGGPVIVCGNSDYTITFDFDSDWNLTGPKTARFVYVKGGEVLHEDKVFSGKTVAVPVLSDVSFVDVGVFAGDLCTTTPARIRCKRSILCGSGEVHEPTPDVYAQIMALFNEMAEQGAFGATEAQAQQIEANKQNIAKLTNGGTRAGDAAKLGGQGPDHYATAKSVADIINGTQRVGDSAKLGGEPSSHYATNTALYAVQSTATAVLSKAGWYRIAKKDKDYSTTCLIHVGNEYHALGASESLLLYSDAYNNPSFSVLASKYANTQLFPKVRKVVEGSKAYIEVYYAYDDYANGSAFSVLDFSTNKNYPLRTITPVMTQETVEGATVVITYDIPANARPVTDLDLADYLPLSGGKLTADLYIAKYNNGSMRLMKNHSATADYGIRIYDISADGKQAAIGLNAKGNAPYFIDSDGNESNLLHLRNYSDYVLPISGGTVSKAHTIPLTIKNTNSGADSFLSFANAGGHLGAVGTSNNGDLYFKNKAQTANHKIHHDGNSAKVAIQSTAPTDGLWVW